MQLSFVFRYLERALSFLKSSCVTEAPDARRTSKISYVVYGFPAAIINASYLYTFICLSSDMLISL